MEVTPSRARYVERLFKGHGVDLTPIGKVAARPAKARGKGKGKGNAALMVPTLRITSGRKVLIDLPVADMEAAWNDTFWNLMG